MVTQFTPANAPTPQQKWVRQTQAAINAIEREIEVAKNGTRNSGSSTAGTLSRMQLQVADLRDQANQLQASLNYQASLVTASTQGTEWLSGDIPGDQTTRWTSADRSTLVKINAPTGRVLAGWGCGTVEARAGNSTMYAYVRVLGTSPSGWSASLGGATRMFVTAGTILGLPFYNERTFENVPKDEELTFEVQFGTWSAATGPMGTAAFYTPFVRAQVVPALG